MASGVGVDLVGEVAFNVVFLDENRRDRIEFVRLFYCYKKFLPTVTVVETVWVPAKSTAGLGVVLYPLLLGLVSIVGMALSSCPVGYRVFRGCAVSGVVVGGRNVSF